MKANPTEQEPVTFALEPDTMGCVIRCLPYIIRERAYELFEARGRQPGHEVDDSEALSTFGLEARNSIDQTDELGDADTSDLFTEVSRGIDKWLWFIEAHSQAAKL